MMKPDERNPYTSPRSTNLPAEDPFLSWLVENIDVVQNGTAYYEGCPVTGDTQVTRYHVVMSLIVRSFRFPTRLYVIGHDAGFDKGLLFSLPSLILGWWGIPWGIIWTISSVLTNIAGGEKQSVRQLIEELTGHRRFVLEVTEAAAAQVHQMIADRNFPSDTAIRVVPNRNRGIYLTQPPPRDCGWINESNGAGSTCTACWAKR
jgi:hypothetical protein